MQNLIIKVSFNVFLFLVGSFSLLCAEETLVPVYGLLLSADNNDSIFGNIIAESTGTAGPDSGNTIIVNGKISLSIPGDAFDSTANVRLIHSVLPVAPAANVGTHIVYLASEERPLIANAYSLSLPLSMAPEGLALNEIAVYALYRGRSAVQIVAEIDTVAGTATISRPDVTITSDLVAAQTLAMHGYTLQSNEGVVAEVGFLLGAKSSLPPTCENGVPGEIHEESGHFFTINITENTDCAYVTEVSNLLQEALGKHQLKYPHTDGSLPLDHLSSGNRMAVYIKDLTVSGSQAEYSYKSYNGYLNVHPSPGGDIAQQREDMFHEMFHAVQNDFMNMMLSYYGNETWWMEATAEYVGYTSSRAVFPPAGDQLIKQMLNRAYFLSLDILDSWNWKNDSYAFSTLIHRAEDTTPGYILNTLQSYVGGGLILSRGLWDTLSFPEQYEDWLQDMLDITLLPGSNPPWLSGRLEERVASTRFVVPTSQEIGEGGQDYTNFSTDAERYEQTHVFGPDTVAKMATRFYKFYAANDITPDRSLRVTVTGDVNVLLVKQKGNNLTYSSMPPEGQTVHGLGSTVENLWIAIYNPSRNMDTPVTLSLDLAKAPGTCSSRGLSGPEVVGDWQRCDDGQLYSWADAQAYCEDLELDGYTNWHLPWKDYLKSLVVCTNGTSTPLADNVNCGSGYDTPTIDPQFSCQVNDYWSSSSYDSARAWKVEFWSGRAVAATKTTGRYVRCARW
jgi:Protein of unknown function (DUF1566)